MVHKSFVHELRQGQKRRVCVSGVESGVHVLAPEEQLHIAIRAGGLTQDYRVLYHSKRLSIARIDKVFCYE